MKNDMNDERGRAERDDALEEAEPEADFGEWRAQLNARMVVTACMRRPSPANAWLLARRWQGTRWDRD